MNATGMPTARKSHRTSHPQFLMLWDMSHLLVRGRVHGPTGLGAHKPPNRPVRDRWIWRLGSE
jgi:hypothetical protein